MSINVIKLLFAGFSPSFRYNKLQVLPLLVISLRHFL